MNRRRLGYDEPFKPYYFSGCVLWLRADLGITTVDAAVVDGSDLTTAAWTKTNCTATATQITDSNDGVPTSHSVLENAPTALQINHIATSTFDLRAGTLGWVQCWCGDNSYAYVNLATGAIGITYQATASTADLGGGWWRLTMTSTVGISTDNLYVFTANANGGSSYTGNGLGTIFATNITVTQRNVSAWAEQSGNGNHLDAVAAASRPFFADAADSAFNGQRVILGDGVDDRVQTTPTFTGATSMFVVARTLASASDAGIFGAGVASNNGPGAFTHHNGATVLFYCGNGWATFAQGLNETIVLSGTWTGDATANGIKLYKNGTLGGQASAAGAGTAEIMRACLCNGAYGNVKLAEAIRYNRVLADSERQTVERYLGARYGISVP